MDLPSVHIIVDGVLHKLCRVPSYLYDDDICCRCSLHKYCNEDCQFCLGFTNFICFFKKSKL